MTYPTPDRRRVLAAAALGRNAHTSGEVVSGGVHRRGAAPAYGDAGVSAGTDEGTRAHPAPVRAVVGEVRDVSPHLIIVETPDGHEERLVIAPWATAWRGAKIAPADLPQGAGVIIRTLRDGKVAEQIWSDITRITGTILSIVADGKDQVVELDCGPHRGRRSIRIPYRASGRIQVRHPKFEPGYLFDAIGVRGEHGAIAYLPATSQPAYRATAVPSPPPVYGGAQSRLSGAVTWADTFDEEEHGASYPMLERSDTGCADSEISCTGLPYLSLGSMLTIRNVCADRSATVPIVACGCLAGRFCDRCVECDTSPRGRIAELSPISFVELGGDLTKGCFNALVGLG
ncbi:hypothetical protein HNP84_000487 [Thermocatellispora tengchongensis]|uniref:Uncharacterized protein n=1 Tax=Thermocatellispora tengchongensis TaxID=1073253 RepID=A0A840NVG4_9ACTN|nr:hypothetical protein [Thermocatellispora tengchongensis]MBB5130799.1 hypothetical protein [Thermocatellispora tengchongensis]